MKYSGKDLKTAKHILDASVKAGVINETKLLTWVSRLKRLGPKKGLILLQALLKQVSDFHQRQILVVESARQLHPSYLEDIKKIFETRLRKSLKLEFRKNKSLLAGVKIILGDTVWDYSVKETLESLKEIPHG